MGDGLCNFDNDDPDPEKINADNGRPATSTSGYLSNISQRHPSSTSSPTVSPSVPSTWRSTDDSDVDRPSNVKSVNSLSFVSPQSSKPQNAQTQSASIKHATNTPDLVKSTKNKSLDSFDSERIVREIGLPKKIDIPQRYTPESENELTMEELTKRSMKAESFRKMLSDAAYSSYTPIHRRNQSNSSFCSIGGPSSSIDSTTLSSDDLIDIQPLRKICSSGDIKSLSSSSKKPISGDVKNLFTQEKKRRADLLALSSEIAKEATEKSRKVAS